MVTHTRLQQYKHHYGMVCLTGMFGCRWHRYQQSTDDTKKVDVVWFVCLVFASLFIILWFYFWLMAENSYDDLNWYIFKQVGSWVPAYTICLILTCITLAYVLILVILALCHIGHGHQIYMHHLHKILLILTLAGCISMTVLITDLWMEGWYLQLHSFMITGPFLHVASVAVVTFLSWFVASNLCGLRRRVLHVCIFVVYGVVLVGLYFTPIFIQSPCVTQPEHLPSKPGVISHRGTSGIAPENTMIAFEMAASYKVLAFETDVSVSYDGVPFLLHDKTLRRTTNVDQVFPDLATEPAAMFNYTDLSKLDAGSWFLETNPHGTVSTLSEEQKNLYKNQTIPTLAQLAGLSRQTGIPLMFDISMTNDVRHPYNDTYVSVIIDTLVKSGLQPEKVWWLQYYSDHTVFPENFTRVLGIESIESDEEFEELHEYMKKMNIEMLNTHYKTASWPTMQSFNQYNMSSNINVVNSPWLYSLYWCMGAESVTTDFSDTFSRIMSPIWLLTPTQFRVMWITTDVLSLLIVIFVFVIQGLKHSKHFQSEAVTLPAVGMKVGGRKHNRNMKIKLINAAEGLTEEVEPGISGISTQNDLETWFMLENFSTPSPTKYGTISDVHSEAPDIEAIQSHLDSGSVSGDSSSNGVILSTNRTSAISTGSDITASSLNRTVSEDEVGNGIKLTEIKLE